MIYVKPSVAFWLYRSEHNFTIDGQNYYHPQILSGTSRETAQKLCEGKGMTLLEPKDSTTDYRIWEEMSQLTNYPYWINIYRDNPNSKYDLFIQLNISCIYSFVLVIQILLDVEIILTHTVSSNMDQTIKTSPGQTGKKMSPTIMVVKMKIVSVPI